MSILKIYESLLKAQLEYSEKNKKYLQEAKLFDRLNGRRRSALKQRFDNYSKKGRKSRRPSKSTVVTGGCHPRSIPPDELTTDVIFQFEYLLRRLTTKFSISVRQEAILRALFLMWQPHQVENLDLFPGEEAFRVMYERKKRSSKISKELRSTLRIQPQIMQIGGGLTGIGSDFSAKVSQILDSFMNLRPFISENLSWKVATELAEFLTRAGYSEAAHLPRYFADLVWQRTFKEESRMHVDFPSYLESTRSGNKGPTKRGDLIDFSIIILDELFIELGIVKGRDAQIKRILNIMSGSTPVFKKVKGVAARRRDLWKKPKWKQMGKMRKMELTK